MIPMMTRRIRLPHFTHVLVAVLLVLLPLLAYMQYSWQGSVSERLREQMQETMRLRAGQFSGDFTREIGRVTTAFQVASLAATKVEGRNQELREDVTDLYSRWRQTATYPQLVTDVYVIPQTTDSNLALERLNPIANRFEEVEWPGDLIGLREAQPSSTVRFQLPMGSAHRIDRRIPAIIISVSADQAPVMPGMHFELPMPSRAVAQVVVKLNLEYIRKELIPSLAKQYVSNSDGTPAYQLAIVDRGDPPRMIYSSNGSESVDVKGDIQMDMLGAQVVDLRGLTGSAGARAATMARDLAEKRGTSSSFLSIQIQSSSGQGREPIAFVARAAESNPWQLVLTHQAGSVDKAVASARNRNLVISFGILLLLAVSVVLILATSQRERRLAQQQMEFVSAVSHELRTPLAVICSAGENLADGVVRDQEQTRQYGALVRNEGRRLTEMVEQVLDFAGIQSGKKAYRVESTPVDDIIDRALETFEMQIRETGVVLEKRLTPDFSMIMAGRSALVRAIQNLLSNALKYGDVGKFLSVRTEATSDQVTIFVEDHGKGIASADLPHIFEPFYRGSAAVDAQIKGSGLGLALVKQIVEAHSGRITVEDTQPSGTVFKVVLPRSATAPGIVASHDQAYSSR